MQLLDDDMDELFRKAASQYPLKTDGANWDAVLSRLPQSAVKKPVSSFNRVLRWLWKPLLVLMVVGASIPSFKTGDLKPRTYSNAIVEENLVVNEVKIPLKSNDPVVVTNQTIPIPTKTIKTNTTNNTGTTSISTTNNTRTTNISTASTNTINHTTVSPVINTTGLTLSGTNDSGSRLSMHALSGADVSISVSNALQGKTTNIPVTPVKTR